MIALRDKFIFPIEYWLSWRRSQPQGQCRAHAQTGKLYNINRAIQYYLFISLDSQESHNQRQGTAGALSNLIPDRNRKFNIIII